MLDVIHEKAVYLRCAAPGLPDGAAVPRAALFSAAMLDRAAGARAAGAGPTARDRPAERGGG